MRDGVEHSDRVGMQTAAGAVTLYLAVGNLRGLTLCDGARRIAPLATAPWVDDGAEGLPEDLAPVERHLAGDFFCAPFGASDVEPAPPHGWPANSAWTVTWSDAARIEAVLARPVMGAEIRKRLTQSPEAPLLMQEHWISGGEGALTVAHHPMVRLSGAGRFATSPKQRALTPEAPLEPGRNRLATGMATAEWTSVPGADGGAVDLRDLPIGTAHEDFVTLVEASDSPLGWSAITRVEEDDIIFFLKDPAVLPVTMLWHSNGGRDYAPWNGRHRGVLGVEDGCAAGVAGHRAALGETAVSALGVPTALPLGPGKTHRIAHVIGAIARPTAWTTVTDIRIADGALIISGDAGPPRRLPFPTGFFARKA